LYEALLAAGRGERQTAVAEADQAVSMAEASSQAGYYVRLFLLRRAEIGLDVGRPDLARADAERLIALERKAIGPGALASTLGRGYLLQGRALLAQGKVAEAQGALALALEHLQPTLGKDHPLTRLARQLGGSAIPRL
jgi:tetratricopeptide (TPR) repeat protein